MPSFVGSVNITNNSGTIQFGSTANNSSKSASKTFSGAGGSNIGNIVNVINEHSETNTWEAGAPVALTTQKCAPKRAVLSKKKKRK